MRHEFKIILGFDDNEKDKYPQISVYVDDKIIGCIQDVKFSANCRTMFPNVEITFPDLSGTKSSFKQEIKNHLNDLQKVPGMSLILEKKTVYHATDDFEIKLEEVGTDGVIEFYI